MNKRVGNIYVFCSCKNRAVPGLRVSLVNSRGTVVQECSTNRYGCAAFIIDQPDYYQVCVLPTLHYLPCNGTSCCSLFATPCRSYCYALSFVHCCKQPTGRLTVYIHDANFPDYTLNEGEITLWRGLK